MDNKENPATARKAIVEPKLRATAPKIKALNVEHITDHDMNKERAKFDKKGGRNNLCSGGVRASQHGR